mmetsp:Transcript_13536/g.42605  ORF Transcript_13536/g.42605 Transcript_13536/m.42605 type:complete len:312 (+) Transcript_13536:612-1547(+)
MDVLAVLLEDGGESLVVALVDNVSVVGRVGGVVAVELGERRDNAGHQPLLLCRGDKHVVGSKAGLPRVEEAAPRDAARGDVDSRIARHDGRRLAAQLQRHRRQVLGSCTHHNLGDKRRTRIQNVVKHTLFEEVRRLGHRTLHDRRGVWVQVTLDETLKCLGRRWRKFRRLDDHGVTGGNGADKGYQGELQGIVPRDNVENDAERVAVHHGLVQPVHQGEGTLGWLVGSPLVQIVQRLHYIILKHDQLRQVRFASTFSKVGLRRFAQLGDRSWVSHPRKKLLQFTSAVFDTASDREVRSKVINRIRDMIHFQ